MLCACRLPPPPQPPHTFTLNSAYQSTSLCFLLLNGIHLQQHFLYLTSITCWFAFRRWMLERKLQDAEVPVEEQNNILKHLEKKETEYMRLQRHKIGVEDFELLTIIGRGAFGEVLFILVSIIFLPAIGLLTICACQSNGILSVFLCILNSIPSVIVLHILVLYLTLLGIQSFFTK